jgi:CRISPR-associated endonuclease/helicase Cas3
VFRAPTDPPGSLNHHKQIAETMLMSDSRLDLLHPDTFRSYFDRLYAERERDAYQVQVSRQMLHYKETASRFRMMDDATTTVIVPYDITGRRAIEALRHAGPSRERFRSLQPYGVSVYPNALRKLQERGAVELLHDALWILVSADDYHPNLGLLFENESSDRFVL